MATSLKYFIEVLLAIQYMHKFRRYKINIPQKYLFGECVKLTDYDLKMATGRRIIRINNIIINPNSGKKARNIFNNLEQIKNSKINDINKLADIILNSVNLFYESQNNLEGLVGKLLSVSTDKNFFMQK